MIKKVLPVLLALIVALGGVTLLTAAPASASTLTGYEIWNYASATENAYGELTIYFARPPVTKSVYKTISGPWRNEYLFTAPGGPHTKVVNFLGGNTLMTNPPGSRWIICWQYGTTFGTENIWDLIYTKDSSGHGLWAWFPDYYMNGYAPAIVTRCNTA